MFHLLRAYFSGYRYLTFYTLVRVLEIGKFTAFLEVPLNVHQGKLFVVGYPGTRVELKYYGNPQPPYVGFRYDDGQWRRIPFTDILEAIYETNKIVALTDVHGNFANLTQKAKAREYRIAYERRIDPAHRYVP